LLLFSSAGQPAPKLNRIKEEEENGKLQTVCLRDGCLEYLGSVVQKSIEPTLTGCPTKGLSPMLALSNKTKQVPVA